MLSHETIDRIQPTDPRLLAQAQARIDRLTKADRQLGPTRGIGRALRHDHG